MLDQDIAVARRKIPSFVRVQVNVTQRVIADLRRVGLLRENECHDKHCIAVALMRAAIDGIKAV